MAPWNGPNNGKLKIHHVIKQPHYQYREIFTVYNSHRTNRTKLNWLDGHDRGPDVLPTVTTGPIGGGCSDHRVMATVNMHRKFSKFRLSDFR